LIQIIVNSR